MKYYKKVLTYIQSLGKPFPLRDWYAVLAASVILFIALVGTALYFFIGIQSGAIIVPRGTGVSPTPSVSREDLDNAIELYKERDLNFRSDNVRVPDVSNPAR